MYPGQLTILLTLMHIAIKLIPRLTHHLIYTQGNWYISYMHVHVRLEHECALNMWPTMFESHFQNDNLYRRYMRNHKVFLILPTNVNF